LVVDNLLATTALAVADDDLEAARRLLPRAVEMLREQQRWGDLGNCLRVAAAMEFKRGCPERSAALLGAVLRLPDERDVQDELLLPELARLRADLNARLGARAFADASWRGAEMSLDDVAGLLVDTP
jgi:hypothetical protein